MTPVIWAAVKSVSFFRSYTGYLETELAQFTEIHLFAFGKGFQQIVYSSGENGHHIGATHGSL